MIESIPDTLLRLTIATQGAADQMPPSLWGLRYFYVVILASRAQPEETTFVAALGGWLMTNGPWILTVDGIERRLFEFVR